jgi:hypothetical protein
MFVVLVVHTPVAPDAFTFFFCVVASTSFGIRYHFRIHSSVSAPFGRFLSLGCWSAFWTDAAVFGPLV